MWLILISVYDAEVSGQLQFLCQIVDSANLALVSSNLGKLHRHFCIDSSFGRLPHNTHWGLWLLLRHCSRMGDSLLIIIIYFPFLSRRIQYKSFQYAHLVFFATGHFSAKCSSINRQHVNNGGLSFRNFDPEMSQRTLMAVFCRSPSMLRQTRYPSTFLPFWRFVPLMWSNIFQTS